MSVDHQYIEVSPQRAIGGAEFGNGLQDFIFNIQRPNACFMDKSYMKFEMKVTGPGGAVPNVGNQIALAENCIANMYLNAIFMAGGQNVSSLMNYFPQCSAVEYRTSHSGAWLDRVGAYTQCYNGDRSSRIAALSSTLGATQLAIPLAEGKAEIYKPTDGRTPDTANVTVATATGVCTGALGTLFTDADIGSTIVINGCSFRIKSRTSDTEVVLDSPTIGAIAATTNWHCGRRNLIYSTQARNTVQVLWRPTGLGIFRHNEPLGSGAYQLQLSPNPNFKLTAIEYPYSSATGYRTAALMTAAVYDLNVVSAKLYIAIAKMSIPDSIDTLRLTEYHCQSKKMSNESGDFQWTIPASTTCIYMFLQDTTAGSNCVIPPSVFRVNGSGTAGVLPVSTGEEQPLTLMQVTYANVTKPPSATWGPGFAANSNYLVQMYFQSQIENHAEDDVGGIETMDQWLQRGPLYCWRFERDASDRSVEVQTQVTYTMTPLMVWQTANLFLCAEFTKATEISTSNGAIVSVRSLNI